jgi:hypothetical protein
LGVAGEMNFDALREQTLAAALTAAGKSGTTGFGLHAGTEPELLFPCAFGWLIGAFHKRLKIWSVKKEGEL